VPAEALAELNAHIAAPIRVIHAFFGAGFSGLIPTAGALHGQAARISCRRSRNCRLRASLHFSQRSR